MTSINSNYFNFSAIQKSGITASSKKMTDEEMANIRRAMNMDTPIAKNQHSQDPSTVEKGMREAEGRVATPQTQVDAQILAEEQPLSPGEQAIADFLDFNDKSWEERMRAMILRSLGLTEEDLTHMEPEELVKIEEKIKEKIKQEVEKETGVILNDA